MARESAARPVCSATFRPAKRGRAIRRGRIASRCGQAPHCFKLVGYDQAARAARWRTANEHGPSNDRDSRSRSRASDCTLACRVASRSGRRRPGSGIRFVRTDRPGTPRFRRVVEHAVLTERRTQLGTGDDAVHTVEHVLAAVAGAELDDLTIELDGPEPPIMDGSAAPFLDALAAAGPSAQRGQVQYLTLRSSVRVVDGESVYEAHPAAMLDLVGHDRVSASADRPPGVPLRCHARRVRPRARTGAHVRLRSRGRRASVARADSRRRRPRTRSCSTTKASWKTRCVGRTNSCGTRRWIASATWRSPGARVRAQVVAHKPSHRGTILLVRELTKQAGKESTVLGIEDIMKVLPHRYPFLLVDRILEIEHGKRIVGLKNVTINEPFFQGHFPGHPIMPGVLIIEAMAQVGGMLLMGTVDDPETQGRVLHVARQREVAAAGEAGRPAALRARRGPDPRRDLQDARRREGRRRGGRARRRWPPWCATDERDDGNHAGNPSDRASCHRGRSSATTSRSARSRSSARAA